MMRLSCLIACACLLLRAFAPAQRHAAPATDAPGNYKLLAVKARGSARYSDKEILAASGLQLGKAAGEADFREAAQQLLGSGMFTDVAYTFSYSEAGIKVEFELTDAEKSKLVPARFENFVGITESALRALVGERVPLFTGELPLTGQLTDQVTHALQSLLEERHLPGQVDSSREAEQADAPPAAILFTVHELSVRVHNVEFPGATAEQTAFLTYAVRRMIGAPYSSPQVAKTVGDNLLPLFLQRGYLRASFGSPETRIVTKPTPEAEGAEATSRTNESPVDEIEIDVILPVTPGKQYSVAGFDWKGNSVIPTKDASALFHLSAGQPADAVALRRDVETLIKLYQSKGYMTARVSADPDINEGAGMVRYEFTIAEGDLYAMGELEFLGLDNASKTRLLDAWKLPEGKPYNPEYTRKFIEGVPQLLPAGLQYTTKLSEDLDAKAKAVDVTIRFKTD